MEIKMKVGDFIVSKTDIKGHITYGNEIFIKMSGYSESELLGAPHNILRHQEMPAAVFKLLWERMHSRKAINAYVKNRCKSGEYYWVFANVTPSFDEKGDVIGYYSVRRKPSDKAMDVIEPLYSELLKIQKESGLNLSYERLHNILDTKGVSYDEFITSLQK